MNNDVEKLTEILLSKKPGGTVLVENYAPLGTEAILTLLLRSAEERGTPVLIEDILDTLPVYIKHLKLMDVDVDLDKSNVLKIGGSEAVGNIVKRMNFDVDLKVYLRQYEKAFSEVSIGEPFIDIILGFERIFAFNDNIKDLYTLISSLRQFITDKKRRAFYFIESPIMNKLKSSPRPILEDLATSVVSLSEEKEMLRVRIRKDPMILRLNIGELVVPLSDILRIPRELANDQ
ncbi:DUF257 family protein [Thermococcus sp. Bubb.Bath]|uniref:DUF257 family protein n=1 Tax=Thermococcus sp. Bubb.Bath TaxID=1638242 RepID=UPI00143A0FDD|nr:DUF257 family protein [Thermococcus sp. Bubb.Bath]NJF25295.1 hypothetical protein [Thermococcus sp. Bubb.Bath]